MFAYFIIIKKQKFRSGEYYPAVVFFDRNHKSDFISQIALLQNPIIENPTK